MSEALELYAYSTDKYLESNLIKVGHCRVGRHEDRIWEQFQTSNPEPPRYQLIGILPEGIRDTDIHNILLRNGCKKPKNSPGKEWFIVPSTEDPFKEVRKAYHQIVYGSTRSEKFLLRREQKEAVEKAKKWFLKGYPTEVIQSATYENRFLINAKMRFGKCFTSINLAKELNAKFTLIVTYKPDVIAEWIDTVNEQVEFNGWTGVRAKQSRSRPFDPSLSEQGEFPSSANGPVVLCVSLQDLYIDENGQTKTRLHKIPDISWDLVIFDEVHYGSRTDRAKDILSRISFKWRLDLSGTPFRLVEQDDFAAQQVYIYSYLDEQQNKKNEILADPQSNKDKIYRQLPDLNISSIEITKEDINEQLESFQTDDIDFSLNRLFETRDGKFIYDEAVDHFIDGLAKQGHEARAVSVFGRLGQQLGCPAKRHTVWWLKWVDSITALIEKLDKHPHFSNFKIINASGSDRNLTEDERIIAKEKSAVENAIEEANTTGKYGTITLTCGRFLTGVTIKEWDSILILNDVQSAESYFQAIFRVQSAWVNKKTSEIVKKTAWVFDFAIYRCLQVTYDCAVSIANQVDQQEAAEQRIDVNRDNVEIVASGLCDTLNIKRFFQGSLASDPTTAQDILEALNHGSSKIALARKITSNALVKWEMLKLLNEFPDILEILGKVKGYRTQDVGSISSNKLVEIGIEAEELANLKNNPNLTQEEKEKKIKTFEEKEKDKEKQTLKKWYGTQIKRLAICMADFIYMTYEREYKIDDVIQTKSPEFFEVMTGISKDDFVMLCNLGFMNKDALNGIVRNFRDLEATSLAPEDYILQNLRKMAA